jgi:predicted metalloprotease with PDZ domain
VMDNAKNQAISLIEYDSPAQHSGLSAQDQILAIDGVPTGKNKIDDLLKTRKAGDRVKFLIAHRNTIREVEVVLGAKMQKSFKIQPLENPTESQAAILKDWLKN